MAPGPADEGTLTRAAGPHAPVAARRTGLSRLAPLERVAHPALIGFLLFAAAAVVARIGYLGRPVEYDAGQYLYVGQVILDGGTPYVEAANNKGPALFLLFALIRLATGTSDVVFDLIALLFTALTALALAAVVERRAGRAPAAMAGLLLAALVASPKVNGVDLYAEHFGLAPMMAALWLAGRGGLGSAAGAGAMAAVATLMHPAFGLVVPFAAFELWSAGRGEDRWRALGVGVAGAVAVAIPVLGWLALSGALDDMVLQVGGQIVESGSTATTRGGYGSQLAPLDRDPELFVLFALGLLGSAVAALDPRRRALAIGAAIWVLIAWVRVEVSGYAFAHHYVLVLPGVAVGLALGLDWLWRRLHRTALRLAVTLPVLALLWLAVLSPAVGSLLGTSVGEGVYREGGYDYAAEVDFVRSNTQRDETVLAIAPQILWQADRQAPSRFFDFYEVLHRSDYRRERVREVLRDPPAAMVLAPTFGGGKHVQRLLDRYEWAVAGQTERTIIMVRRGSFAVRGG